MLSLTLIKAASAVRAEDATDQQPDRDQFRVKSSPACLYELGASCIGFKLKRL